MISDRTTNSLLATLLSIPPIVLVATLVDRMLPPPPHVPAVVAANDQRVAALQLRPKLTHVDGWDQFKRQMSAQDVSDGKP